MPHYELKTVILGKIWKNVDKLSSFWEDNFFKECYCTNVFQILESSKIILKTSRK